MSAEGQRELVERATAYPYAAPSHSFVQLGKETLDPADVDVDLSTRTPLLAYGANAAPSVLARKLGDDAEPVALRRAAVRDFDVVYSAHISPYGAIPATLQRCRGCEAPAFVAYLSERQLELICRTEPNYELALLDGISCDFEGGGSLSEIAGFLSRHGCLALEGSEIALSAVQARGRRFPELSEMDMLERVRDQLAPDLTLERFITENATRPERGRALTAALKKTARPLERPPRTVLRRSGT